jgi:hypothetical protein
MKLVYCSGAAAVALISAAFAGELTDACVARLQADGRDTSGCSCLEDRIAGNAELEAEFQTLKDIADPAARYEAASDAAKAAMDACTR